MKQEKQNSQKRKIPYLHRKYPKITNKTLLPFATIWAKNIPHAYNLHYGQRVVVQGLQSAWMDVAGQRRYVADAFCDITIPGTYSHERKRCETLTIPTCWLWVDSMGYRNGTECKIKYNR